jgi:hypothetical protein
MNPSTQSIGSWMGPRNGLDIFEKRKASRFNWDLKPWIVYPVAQSLY